MPNSVSNQYQLERFYPIDSDTPSRVVTGIASGVALNTTQRMLNVTTSSSTANSQPIQRVSRVGNFGRVVVLAPLIEEACFRGIFADAQRTRRSESSSITDRVIDASTNAGLFTLAHYNPRTCFRLFARSVPSIFFSGLALSYLTEQSGSLIEPTVAHSVSNAITQIMSRGRR